MKSDHNVNKIYSFIHTVTLFLKSVHETFKVTAYKGNIVYKVCSLRICITYQFLAVAFFREDLTGQLIERVATEFNKLQFYVNKSRGAPLVETIKPVSDLLSTILMSFHLGQKIVHLSL